MLSRVRSISAVQAATAGTVAVGGFSFLVSYTALSELAEYYKMPDPWSAPLIVDGLVIVSTIAATAMRRHSWYAWVLLFIGAMLSVAGNGLQAWHTTGSYIAIGIAAVPPLVLLAVTHLTMVLRDQAEESPAVAEVRELPATPAVDPFSAALERLVSEAPAAA
ncbi:DUF2637 domain-containing protein [Nocardia yunnanensis]|uniref:DUF2637 domain-containing protein n=1 Tax=Nocardia yunnanensis TaxID=2382165 RepID=A0A386ZI44_9NOCA|nr:DUF2637 domain-containing protein [Nocardia yunnanensis]AYF77156.1 DUF2637 domain-containing protein [Nocardia yunnanensis]